MPPLITTPHALKERKFALKAIEAALKNLDATELDPDPWEEHCLVVALAAFACELYPVVVEQIDVMARPILKRSPLIVAALSAQPRSFPKEMLRAGLARIDKLK